MKLMEITEQGNDSTEIRGLCFDSRKVQAGDAFFAVRGHAQDGHRFLPDVIKKQPSVLVVEDRHQVPREFSGAVVVVPNVRVALDEWSARFFGHPAQNLFCMGVTGTNGKTTSVYMLERVFGDAGRGIGVIGTIDHHYRDKKWETSNTTPDPVTMQSRLRQFLDLGAQGAAFEVTSIAIDQNRASSIPYDAALFTNFTRDHLDYHGSMENYFLAKQKLFDEILGASTKRDVFAILNADDPAIAKVRIAKRARAVWFGDGRGDYRFRIAQQTLGGSTFTVERAGRRAEIHLPTPGLHNIYNAVGVFALAAEAGVSFEKIAEGLGGFSGAPGRFQSVPNRRGLHVFIDYAHTDDALHAILTSLRRLMASSNSPGKLWTVFGCGGDRDRGKRPLMAKAAVEHSDHVVITSDNPRTEDPEAIIRDCLSGIPGRAVFSEPDRKKGIAFALQRAAEGDVILVAGKGHEDYQIIGQTKYPFSDAAVVRELLA